MVIIAAASVVVVVVVTVVVVVERSVVVVVAPVVDSIVVGSWSCSVVVDSWSCSVVVGGSIVVGALPVLPVYMPGCGESHGVLLCKRLMLLMHDWRPLLSFPKLEEGLFL